MTLQLSLLEHPHLDLCGKSKLSISFALIIGIIFQVAQLYRQLTAIDQPKSWRRST